MKFRPPRRQTVPSRAPRRAMTETLEPRRLLSVGDLDAFYGGNGVAVANSSPEQQSAIPDDVAALPDGRTYVLYGGSGYGVSRLTYDGELDPTFGNGGIAVIPSGDTQSTQTAALVIQPDGKVLVTAEVLDDFGVARINPDGTPDASFGTNGTVHYNVGDSYLGLNAGFDYPHQLLLQADGKIVVLGQTENGSRRRAAVLRLNPDGSVDTGFGTNGRIVTDVIPALGDTGSSFEDGLVLPDGKLLMVGGADSSPSRLVLAHYNPDGSNDTSFGDGGFATEPSNYYTVAAVTPAPGGGYYGVLGSSFSTAVAHFTEDGKLDDSFGLPRFGLGLYRGADIAVQRDGSIVASAGFFSSQAPYSGYAVAGFTPNGQLLFGDTRQLGQIGGGGTGLALQPHGRMVVTAGGLGYPPQDPFRPGPMLVRYLSMPQAGKGASLDGGIVEVVGDDSANRIDVGRSGDDWTVTLDDQVFTFRAADVSRVDVRAEGGDDAVTFSGDTVAGNVDLGAGNDAATVNAANLLFGGQGNDTFTFLPGAAGGPRLETSVQPGAGDDVVVLSGTPDADTFRLTQNAVEGPGRRVSYDPNTERLSILAGDGNDQVTIESSSARSTIDGGAGDDTFTAVHGPPTKLQTLLGGPGNDKLLVSGPGTYSFAPGDGSDAVQLTGGNGNDAFTIGQSSITGTNLSVTLNDPASLELIEANGGAGKDTFTVNNPAPGGAINLSGGSDADSFVSTSPSSLSNVFFDAGGDRGDQLTLTDPDPAAHDYVVSPTALRRDGRTLMRSAGIDRLSFTGGDVGNHFSLSDAAGLSAVTLTGGKGPDVFDVSPAADGRLGADPDALIILVGGQGMEADVFRVTPDPDASFRVFGGVPFPFDDIHTLPTYDTGDPNDRLEINFAAAAPPGASAPLYTGFLRGFGRYTFAEDRPIEIGDIDFTNDLPAPGGPGIGFQPGVSPQALVFTFGDGATGLTADDLVLTNTTTGAVIPTAKIDVAYDPLTRAAKFTFPGLPNGRLPGGNYLGVLRAGSVSSAGEVVPANAGAPMKSDYAIQFAAAPEVEAVYVASSAWSESFRSHLAARGSGDKAAGYRVDPSDLARTLPWSNLNQVSIRFNGPVLADMADLVVQGLPARYGVKAFSYDPQTYTATWTLVSPLRADRPAIQLSGDPFSGVRGPDAPFQAPVLTVQGLVVPPGPGLDGEFTGTVPSGNGAARGDFRYVLAVLPGDVTGDGRVNAIDLARVRSQLGRTAIEVPGPAGVYEAHDDVNGDGRINALDLALVRAGYARTLPAGSAT